MKASLVEMDKKGTGRVRLSDFYGEALKTDWRFGESEAYLRQLGALDESSRWLGKQVIIQITSRRRRTASSARSTTASAAPTSVRASWVRSRRQSASRRRFRSGSWPLCRT